MNNISTIIVLSLKKTLLSKCMNSRNCNGNNFNWTFYCYVKPQDNATRRQRACTLSVCHALQLYQCILPCLHDEIIYIYADCSPTRRKRSLNTSGALFVNVKLQIVRMAYLCQFYLWKPKRLPSGYIHT